MRLTTPEHRPYVVLMSAVCRVSGPLIAGPAEFQSGATKVAEFRSRIAGPAEFQSCTTKAAEFRSRIARPAEFQSGATKAAEFRSRIAGPAEFVVHEPPRGGDREQEPPERRAGRAPEPPGRQRRRGSPSLLPLPREERETCARSNTAGGFSGQQRCGRPGCPAPATYETGR